MSDIKQFLKERFGFESFKLGQEETINSLLNNQNTFTVLPTGTGKSLCYQLPSYLLNGQTVIVSPLISLMEDQVTQLRKMGEKSVIALNSTLDFTSKQYVLNHLAKFKFIFISPETLNQEEVFKRFLKLNISLFVIDEAHCISEWGHDFRPSYLALKSTLKKLNNPLTLALTATATEDVKNDIKKELFFMGGVNEFYYSVNRPNIFYEVVTCDEKMEYLLGFLADKNMPGIIYFSSKKEAERVSHILSSQLPYKVAFYHGDVPSRDRLKIQQQFIQDDIRILCATSAFGMGVNKENVRFVIHYHLPDSLENYVQESGRAGRDGKQSLSVILYKEGDERIHHFLQEESFNQKKDLLFLKEKGLSEIKKYQNSLTDVQQKWLNQLEKTNWDWQEFERNLAVKQFEKHNKMYMMMSYIENKGCRRNFLLDYFNHGVDKLKQEVCCDNCQDEAVTLESLKSKEIIDENEFNGKELLKKLFLNKF